MIKYDKLVIVTQNRYDIRTDNISDLKNLFNSLTNVNIMFILVLVNGEDIHPIDLGALLLDHINLLESTDIEHLISQLTPEMIYSYRVDMFNQSRPIRSFMHYDLPGDVTISPCNITTGELTTSSYDPNYKDLAIVCSDYDLTRVLPIIDNKLRYCQWYTKKIMMKDRVDLTRSTKEITFVSFGAVDTVLRSLNELSLNGWKVDTGYIPIIVLCGAMYYDEPFVFKYDRQTNKIKLNQSFVTATFGDFEAVIKDVDSFVILVKADKLLVRNVFMCHDEENKFVYYEDRDQDYHLDYICINGDTNNIHGVTMADELYKNVSKMIDPCIHHVYVNGGGNNMRLVQLTAF